MFVSADSGDALDMGDQEAVEENIPRQFPDENLFKNLGSTAAAVQVASQAAMGFNIVLTLVLSASLKAMWNMVHVIQLIIFLPNVLEWPPNAQLFIDSLSEAVEMETLTAMFYDFTLPSELAELVNNTEDIEVGGVSKNLLTGLGIFMIILGCLILLISFYYCLKWCNRKCTKKRCIKRQ